MILRSLILTILVLCYLSLVSSKSSPTNQQIAASLIAKLLKMCGQTDSVNFLQCEPKLIENDKKNNNYRANYNYTRQSLYMMTVYDTNKDGRLNWPQLQFVAFDIMNEKISDAEINRVLLQIQKKESEMQKDSNKSQLMQEEL